MFVDRKDAAKQMASSLSKYKNQDTLVVGIPRGGLEIAYYAARHLCAEMVPVITHKLRYPSNPEAAFGAMAEDGSVYLAGDVSSTLLEKEMKEIVQIEKEQISRHIRRFRKGRPLPDMSGRAVIIVDDGIATGATVFATIALCRKKHARRIIVAVPIAGQPVESELRKQVDEVIILEKPSFSYVVGKGYRHFTELTDEEAVGFIEQLEQEQKVVSS